MGRVEQDFKNLLTNHVHVQSRTIYITETITAEVAGRVVKLLRTLDAPNATITVVLNTFGGDIYSGLAVYDALRACKATIRTIGIGKVMSMGAVVLQAADGGERCLTPLSTVMVHHGNASAPKQNMDDLMATAQAYKKLEKQALHVLADRMGKSYTRFKDWCRTERNLNAKEAIELGLADRIYEGD